jgi:hypothetical protein
VVHDDEVPTVRRAIVEVHEDGLGNLWMKRGVFNSDGTVGWGAAQWYDRGFKPSVALCPYSSSYSSIVEVHEGGDGTLWTHTGNVHSTSIDFFEIVHYDNGFAAKTACFPTRNYDQSQFIGFDGPTLAFEVHQAASGISAEWGSVSSLWNWF